MHAFILLAWCSLVGYGVAKLLFIAGLESMGVRYAVSVACAYAAFLVGVRVWLSYVGFGEYMDDEPDDASLVTDALDAAVYTDGMGNTVRTAGTPVFKGGGGTYDGGGASGDWDGARSVTSSGSSLGGGRGGGDVSVDGDALPIIVVVGILLLAFIVLTGGVYLGVELLAELAFEMLLVIHIRRGIKKGGLPWLSSAFKNTWWALLLVLAITVGVGTYAQHRYQTNTAIDTVKAMVLQYKAAQVEKD